MLTGREFKISDEGILKELVNLHKKTQIGIYDIECGVKSFEILSRFLKCKNSWMAEAV